MWGYYNNNEGFLLEFNIKYFSDNFHGPFPINYVSEINKIPLVSFDHLTFCIQTNIKKEIWKHENEFRFLVEPKSGYAFDVKGIYENRKYSDYLNKKGYEVCERKIDYPKRSINAIYLGYNFLKSEKISSKDDSYQICLISKNKEYKNRLLKNIVDQKLKCYSIIQNVTNFKLETEKWEIKCKGKYEFEIKNVKRHQYKYLSKTYNSMQNQNVINL